MNEGVTCMSKKYEKLAQGIVSNGEKTISRMHIIAKQDYGSN
jgi:hypothetical protein